MSKDKGEKLGRRLHRFFVDLDPSLRRYGEGRGREWEALHPSDRSIYGQAAHLFRAEVLAEANLKTSESKRRRRNSEKEEV